MFCDIILCFFLHHIFIYLSKIPFANLNRAVSNIEDGKLASGDHFVTLYYFIIPIKEEGRESKVEYHRRSRQEDGASCRLLALIVSRQVARADARLAVPFLRHFSDHRLLPRSLLPTLLSPSRPPPFPLILLTCLPPCRQIGQQTADYA